MHVHGEEHLATNDKDRSGNTTSMANGGVDVRLRRQTPVSVKPPRLRLSATSSAIRKVSTSRLSAQTQQPSSPNENRSKSSGDSYSANAISGRCQNGAANIVPRSSRSSSVSKLSASSSCGRRIKGRSRAGITASTFTPTGSNGEPVSSFSSSHSASLSKVATFGLSRSCDNVGAAVFSTATFENGNSGRPLIHHQRHNLKNRFQLVRTIGEGTYGKVKLAADKSSGEQVAIKYIKKTKIVDDADLARIRREIQILSSLRHSHVVNIREVFEKKDKIVLVMDYAQGGELYDYLNKMGRLSEWEARRIFRQIVSAIHSCHQNGIVHRDLKLENIILDDEGNVKIADFGLANYYSHSSMLTTFCGSPLYASPEIVNGRSYYGPEVDVWSLGVILYTLVYGSMPFESNSLVSLKQQISDGDYRQPDRPSDAAGLIRHMLTVTPSRRATMDDALRHWWVNFGHAQMPNGQSYNPCEADENIDVSSTSVPPHTSLPVTSNAQVILPEALTSSPHAANISNDGRGQVSCSQSLDDSQYQRPRRHSLDAPCPPPLTSGDEQRVQPPAIIHQRNQSSLSSDSDAELELLRSPRWEQAQVQSEGQEARNLQLQRCRRGWRSGHGKIIPGQLDSTGNSVHSSGSESPASNMEDQNDALNLRDAPEHHLEKSSDFSDNNCHQTGQGQRSLNSNVLKLPPSLMDILGGCSEKSLAALLTPDPESNIVSFNPFGLLDDYNKNGRSLICSSNNAMKLSNSAIDSNHKSFSPSLDLTNVSHANDVTNNNVPSSTSIQSVHNSQTPTPSTASMPCALTMTSSTTDTFVFDSERKPKRSILKRRGKFSGADPANRAEDGQKNAEDDSHIPKSGGGHLPRRLPSFRDEAHGIFASKHRASQLLEEAAGTLAPESCSSALLHSHHTPWGKHAESLNDYSNTSTDQSPHVLSSDANQSSSCGDYVLDLQTIDQLTSVPGRLVLPQNSTDGTSTCSQDEGRNKVHERRHASAPVPMESNWAPHQRTICGDVEQDPSRENISSDDRDQDSYLFKKRIDVDIANGNFSAAVVNGDFSVLTMDGKLSNTQLSDPNVMIAMNNSGVNKAKDDILLLTRSADLPTGFTRNRNDPNYAKSSQGENTTVTDIKMTSQRECSANFHAMKPQSANFSSRSSASNSSGDSAYESSSLSSYPLTPPISSTSSTSSFPSTTIKVVRRSTNILKASQLEQARNRLSVSSIGSNSSADILDLSYDSGDSDHFVNLESGSAEKVTLQEDCKTSCQAGYVDISTLQHGDSSVAGSHTQNVQAALPERSTSKKQDLLVKPCTVITPKDPGFSDSSGLLDKDCHNRKSSELDDIDLMIFPDDEERDINQAYENGNHSCSTPAVEARPSTSKLSPGTNSTKSQTFWEGDPHDEEESISGRGNMPVKAAFSREENCLDIKMASLDLEQSQASALTQQQNSTKTLKITESGSPLLYRLTREAQTWL